MMMNSGYGVAMCGGNMLGYNTVETLLEDVSKQMAQSNLSRYSRGSNGQRTGGSMRIVKPTSASNSPRGSIGMGRRRTFIADSQYRRTVAMIDQNTTVPTNWQSKDGLQIPTRSNRPVSWHPSTHLPTQNTYPSSHPVQGLEYHNEFQTYDLPPTPAAVYSGYTSPASNFSPLSLPLAAYQQYPFPETPTSYPPNMSYIPYTSSTLGHQFTQQIPTSTNNSDSSMYSHFDCHNFASNGFDHATAPPTPENFLPIQHPDPTLPSEASIPYHPLSEPEPVGEELIGMGLYDTPDVGKTSTSDPHLDNYRMMSQLLGSSFRRSEPTGKGLKLEETWAPPASDDEAEDDGDEDGEGEDEDEEETRAYSQNSAAQNPAPATANSNTAVQASHNFGHNGWL